MLWIERTFLTLFPPSESEEKFHIALVGAGQMGAVHRDTLCADSRLYLKWICDLDRSRAEALADSAPYSRATEDLDRVLADPRVRLVDVCLPHSLHAEVICKALDAGKDVLCEKPIALNLAEADAILRKLKRTKNNLVIKSYLRHSKAIGSLRRNVLIGEVGTVRVAIGTFASRRHDATTPAWRKTRATAGGGVIMDCGIHLADLVQTFFGPHWEVFAACSKDQIAPGIEGDAVAVLCRRDGVLVSLALTQCAGVSQATYGFEVVGSKGRAIVEQDGDSLICWVEREVRSPPMREANWWKRANEEAIHSAVNQILLGRRSRSPVEARRALALVLAMYQSAQEGRPISVGPSSNPKR